MMKEILLLITFFLVMDVESADIFHEVYKSIKSMEKSLGILSQKVEANTISVENMKKDLKLIESKRDSGICNLKTSEALEQVAMLISSRISSQSNANDNKKQTENNNNEKIIPKDSNPKLIQRNLKASNIDKGKSQDIL